MALVPKQTPVETGTTITLHGKASADRKTVTVRVNHKDARVEGPVEMTRWAYPDHPGLRGRGRGQADPVHAVFQAPRAETLAVEKKDLSIPSGGHVLIGAGPTWVQEERQEFGPPVLSKISRTSTGCSSYVGIRADDVCGDVLRSYRRLRSMVLGNLRRG